MHTDRITSLFSRLSYNPHTVIGTWTIILTAIAVVFGVLLAVRLLAPIRPQALETEPIDEPTTKEVQQSAYIMEA